MLSWSGYAFEDVCRAHIRQIKNALGIGDVTTRESSWVVPGTETECGMKFSQGKFTVGRDYAAKLQERISRTMGSLDRKSILILLNYVAKIQISLDLCAERKVVFG